MPAERSLNFSINVKSSELRVFADLSTLLNKLQGEISAVAASMNALNTAAASLKSIATLSSSIEGTSKAANNPSLGNFAKQVEQVSKATGKSSSVTKELNSILVQQNKLQSKGSTKALADEELIRAKAIVRSIRNATIKLQKDKETIKSLRRQRIGIDEVIGSESALNNRILTLNNTIKTNNSFIESQKQRLDNLGISFNKLNADVAEVKNGYKNAAKEVIPFAESLKNAALLSKRATEEQRRLSKIQADAAKNAANAQKVAINDVRKAEEAFHKEKIRLIKLTSELSATQAKRDASLQKQRVVTRAAPSTTEGTKQQQEAFKAGKEALASYDAELIKSKQVIQEHARVQEATANVAKSAANVQKVAGKEIAAAQNIIKNGFNERSIAEAKAAASARILAQEELAQSKSVLSQRKKELETTIALRNKAAKTAAISAKRQTETSKQLSSSLRNQTSIIDGLIGGFNRVIATQLKYFAATILIFGAITKLKEAFTSLIELEERTARAFAVSRSATILFEERFIALGNTIEEVALRTGISINDVSEAMFQFGSAGLQAEESIAALNSTMNLIQATGANVTQTTKTIAATYRLVGDTLGDVGDLSERFARINDIIAATYRDNQVEINDFTSAMKFALPVSKQLGLSLEETSGIIALLHNNFIRGGEAGRALRVIFSRMAREMDQFSEAFGIALDPNKPIDFIDVMRQVSERMKEGSLTADQVGAVFERMGLRGSNAFLILSQEFNTLEEGIATIRDESAGAADQMARIRRETDVGQLKIFAEIMLKLGREAILPLAAIIIGVVRTINKLQETIGGTWIETAIQWFIRLAAVLALAKIAALAFGLAVKAIGINLVTATTATIAQNIWQWKLWAAFVASGKAAAANAGALFTLKIALQSVAIAATKVLAVLVAVAPYLLVAAAIATITYAIYLLINKDKELIESNNKRITKIREEIREYKNQRDAIGKTIDKLEEINQAYNEGRTTQTQTRVAISEAVRAHGKLGVAAGEAAGEISVFIKKAKEEQRVISELINKLREEEKQKFGENLKVYSKTIEETSEKYQKLQALVKQGLVERTDQRGFTFTTKSTESDIKQQSKILARYSATAREAIGEISKLADGNGELARELSGTIAPLIDMTNAMDASIDSAIVFGDVFDFLEKSARNLAALPFREKIDELGESVSGIEGFRLKALFNFDFVIPTAEITETENKIKEALNRIENISKKKALDVDIQLNLSDTDFLLDLDHVFDNLDSITRIFNTSLNKAISGIETDNLFNLDEIDTADLFVTVTEQVQLLNSEFALTSKEQEKLISNDKNIQSIKNQLIQQTTKITDSETERSVIIEGINSLFGDQLELLAFLNTVQQRQIATTAALDFHERQRGEILKRTRNLSIDQEVTLNRQIKSLIGQNNEIRKQYSQAVQRLAIAKDQQQSDEKLLDLQKRKEEIADRQVQLVKEESQARLNLVNFQNQLNLADIKGKDALNKAVNFGQDRVSQIRASLVNQRAVNKAQIQHLVNLQKQGFVAENRRLIDSKRKELLATIAKLNRQESDEIFKQNIALSESKNKLDEQLHGKDRVLSIDNKLAINASKRIRIEEAIDKLEKKIGNSQRKKLQLGRQQIVQQKELNLLSNEEVGLLVARIDANTKNNVALANNLSNIEQTKVKLLESFDVVDKTAVKTAELSATTSELASVQEQINGIMAKRSPQQELSAEQQVELTNLVAQYGAKFSNLVINKQKELNKLKQQEIDLQNKLLALYGKEGGLFESLASDVEKAVESLASVEFEERPFTTALVAINALGLSFSDIKRLGPQEVLRQLQEGWRNGTVSLEGLNGEMLVLAQNLQKVGAEEQRLRKVQEEIKQQQFASAFDRINEAIAGGNTDKALKFLDDLSKAAQVIDVTTGKIDQSETIKNLEVVREKGEEIGDAIANASKKSNEELNAIRFESLEHLDRLTKSIKNTFETGKFGDEFVSELNKIVAALQSLEGKTVELQISDSSKILAKFKKFHKGGYVTGGQPESEPSVNEVPALLAKNEYVIPDYAVQSLGVGFFERFRNKEFVQSLSQSTQGEDTFSSIFGDLPRYSGGSPYTDSGLVTQGISGNIDSVPASLLSGSFVIPAFAVDALGSNFFGKLTDPELIESLKDTNRDRLIGAVGYSEFSNQREDIFEGQRRLGFNAGGLVGGRRGFKSGGPVRLQEGGFLSGQIQEIAASINRPLNSEQIDELKKLNENDKEHIEALNKLLTAVEDENKLLDSYRSELNGLINSLELEIPSGFEKTIGKANLEQIIEILEPLRDQSNAKDLLVEIRNISSTLGKAIPPEAEEQLVSAQEEGMVKALTEVRDALKEDLVALEKNTGRYVLLSDTIIKVSEQIPEQTKRVSDVSQLREGAPAATQRSAPVELVYTNEEANKLADSISTVVASSVRESIEKLPSVRMDEIEVNEIKINNPNVFESAPLVFEIDLDDNAVDVASKVSSELELAGSAGDLLSIVSQEVTNSLMESVEESNKLNKNLKESSENMDTKKVDEARKAFEATGNIFIDIADILSNAGKRKNLFTEASAAVGFFRGEVNKANKDIVNLSKKLFQAFGKKAVSAINSVTSAFKNLFTDVMPSLFGMFINDFAVASGAIVAQNEQASKDIIDQFNEQRSDLVEQLKRNEISYFDYFNSLEDLNRDKDDGMLENSANIAEELEGVFGNFVNNFTDALTGGLIDMANGFDEFFGNVVDSGIEVAESLFESFGDLGGLIGQGIGTLVSAGGGAAAGGAAGIVGGGPAGLAIGAVIGGVVGEALKSVVPVVGSIVKAFEQMASAAVQSVLAIIPYIVQLATMEETQFQGLLDALQELPDRIPEYVENLKRRLLAIADLFTDIDPATGRTAIQGVIDALLDGLKASIPALSAAVEAVFPAVVDSFIGLFSQLADTLPTLFSSIFTSISNATTQAFQNPELYDGIESAITGISSVLVSSVQNMLVPLAVVFTQFIPTVIPFIVTAIEASVPEIVAAAGVLISTFGQALSSPEIVSQIGDTIKGIFASVGSEFTEFNLLFEAFGGIISQIITQLPNFLSMIGNVSAILVSLGSLVINVFSEIFNILGTLLPPILGLIAPIITTLVAAIGPILGLIQPLLDAIMAVLNPLVGALLAIIQPILDILTPVVSTVDGLLASLVPLFDMLGGLVGVLGGALVQVLEPIIDLVNALVGSLSGVFNVVAELVSIIIAALEPIIGVVADLLITLADALTPILDVLSVFLQGALESLVSILFSVTDVLVSFIENIFLLGFIDKIVDVLLIFVEILKPLLLIVSELIVIALEPLLDIMSTLISVFVLLFESVGDSFSLIMETFGNSIELLSVLFDPAVFGVLLDFVGILNTLAPIIKELAPLLKVAVYGAFLLIITTIGPLVVAMLALAAIIRLISIVVYNLGLGFEYIVNQLDILVDKIEESPIGQFMQDFADSIDTISEGFSRFFEENIVGELTNLANGFDDLTNITTHLTNASEALGKAFSVIEFILWGASLIPAVEALTNVFVILNNFISNTLNTTIETVTNTWTRFASFISDTFNTALATLSGAFSSLLSPIQEVGNFIEDTFISALEGMYDIFQDILSIIPGNESSDSSSDRRSSESNSSSGGFFGAIASIFGFHDGGIFKAPTDPGSREFFSMLGLRPDEGLALLQNNEGILTEKGVNALEGQANLNLINQGRNPWINNDMFQAELIPNASLLAASQIGGTAAVQSERAERSRSRGRGTHGDAAVEEPTDNAITINNGSSNQTINNEATYNVTVDMSGSNFQSESIANDVEVAIAESMQNQDGPMYQEVNDMADNQGTPTSGIRRR